MKKSVPPDRSRRPERLRRTLRTVGGARLSPSATRFIRAMNLLGTRLVPRLLLPHFVAHDALIGTARRLGLRLWHAFLATMFAALILHTFQIVLSGHRDQILSC
jgi:hypothetical protein